MTPGPIVKPDDVRFNIKPVSSGQSSSNGKEMCRICHSGTSESNLISPCRCSGSVRYSHPNCVMRWINYSNKKKCELCKTKFNIQRKGMKPFGEWKNISLGLYEILHLALLTCCILIMIGSVIWWMVVFRGKNSSYNKFFQTKPMNVMVYATYGPLGVLCILLIILELRFVVYPLIKKWKMFNEEFIVQEYNGPPSFRRHAGNDALIIKPSESVMGSSGNREFTHHTDSQHLGRTKSLSSVDDLYNRRILNRPMKGPRYQGLTNASSSVTSSKLSLPVRRNLSDSAATFEGLLPTSNQAPSVMASLQLYNTNATPKKQKRNDHSLLSVESSQLKRSSTDPILKNPSNDMQSGQNEYIGITMENDSTDTALLYNQGERHQDELMVSRIRRDIRNQTLAGIDNRLYSQRSEFERIFDV